MHRMIRIAGTLSVALPLTLGLPTTAGTPGAPPPEVKRIFKLLDATHRHLEHDRHARALKTLGQIAVLAPENPPHYLMAEAYAGLGDRDAAFAELHRALAISRLRADGLRADDDLAALRDDPRLDDLIAAAALDWKAFGERNRTLYRAIDPPEAESFDSAEALAQAFDDREEALEQRAVLLPWRTFFARGVDLKNARIAALERYLADHAEAEDRERASYDSVEAAAALRENDDGWGPEGALVVERAERYLTAFPTGSHAAEVDLRRAVASWRAFDDDDREATRAERAARALPLLESVERTHAEAPEAVRAQAWRLQVLHETADGAITPEQREVHGAIQAKLQDLEPDDPLLDEVWESARPAMFRLAAETDFDSTDLTGRHWTFGDLLGRVVLIDFWATWCGPCMGELPHLKDAYDQFHERGFEIVGVSLDGGKRKAFEKSLREHAIVWPQIWDGKGWQAAAARKFRIRGIPEPFLLDRTGRVVASGMAARGKELVEQVGRLVE